MNLTSLARKTLEESLANNIFILPDEIKEKLKEPRATFVTLTKKGKLRGCMGSLKATRPLYRDVQENAMNAAFNDPRFPRLEREELSNIKIEVSVLSNPEPLEFSSPQDLLKKIKPNMGIILTKGFASATFLPQVWEELENPRHFLEELSQKAGLSKDAWKESKIQFYTVEKQKE